MKLLTSVLQYIVFTLLLALPPVALMYTNYANHLIADFWLMFAFISGLTFIAVMAILIGGQINPEIYAQVFIAATVFKILATLAFIVVFLLKNTVDKQDFTFGFIYLYFLNTAFEVYVLLRNLRNQNLK